MANFVLSYGNIKFLLPFFTNIADHSAGYIEYVDYISAEG